MRDKLKESVIKAIRSGTKLDREQQTWVIGRIKDFDKISTQLTAMHNKAESIAINLAKLELLSVADGSERSQGYVDAVKQIRKLIEDEPYFS